jgi:hypothetical protein
MRLKFDREHPEYKSRMLPLNQFSRWKTLLNERKNIIGRRESWDELRRICSLFINRRWSNCEIFVVGVRQQNYSDGLQSINSSKNTDCNLDETDKCSGADLISQAQRWRKATASATLITYTAATQALSNQHQNQVYQSLTVFTAF